MNPGVTEEAGKAAQSTIEALKSTPVVLALVIFNILFMGLATWTAHETGARYERLLSVAFTACPSLKPDAK